MSTTTELYDEIQAVETGPVLRKGSFYELIFAVLFTALLVWTGFYLLKPSTLPIRQVRIEGEFRHLSTNILQNLVRPDVTGGFFNIDVTAVRNTLLTEPWVRDVSVHRVWPDSLQVFVTEQIAVARWNDTGLLNKSSQIFMPERSSFPDNLPQLEGPEGTQLLMMDKYLSLQKQLEPLAMQVSVLRLDERRAWMFKNSDGLQVVIGRKDFDERVARFIKLMPKSLGSNIHDAEMIDLRYPNGFAVRWNAGVMEIPQESGAL